MPGTPRRARNKSSNIARGMPDVFGCTCDNSCAFLRYYPHTRPRVQRRPVFPAPSLPSRVTKMQNSGKSCRGNATSHPPSLRANGSRERAPDDRLREAIHSAASRDMDCFVASLLAMTMIRLLKENVARMSEATSGMEAPHIASLMRATLPHPPPTSFAAPRLMHRPRYRPPRASAKSPSPAPDD